MPLEVEAKIAVSSLDPIRHRLRQIGADCTRTVQQTDTYLTDSEGRLLKKGCGLRLRRQKSDRQQTVYLTWKGPKLESSYKSRRETELQVSDYDAAMTLFYELGFRPAVKVQKKREIWKHETCWICLDDVENLGYFVEVEGPDETRVQKTLDRLGLSDRPHIPQGYARLTARTLNQTEKNAKNTKERNNGNPC